LLLILHYLLLLRSGLSISRGLVLVILFPDAVKSEILCGPPMLSNFIFFMELIVMITERKIVRVDLIVIKIKDLLLRMWK
jgi:hypothetical protein